MTLKEARYILTVARLQSISKAAESLYISQPHLTRVIQRVEDETECILFDRAKLPIRLTYAGEVLIKYCERMLDLQDEFEKSMKKLSENSAGRIIIGIPPRRGAYLMPLVLPSFARTHPDVEIVIREAHSDVLPVMTEHGDVDISVFSLPEMPKNIHCEVLVNDLLLLMVPPSHELYYESDQQTMIPYLSPAYYPLLDGCNFISIDSPKSITRRLINYLNTQNISCPITLKTLNNEMTYRLCEQDMGMAAVMSIAIRNSMLSKQPCLYQIGDPPLTETWYIGTPEAHELTPVECDFIAAIHEGAQKMMEKSFAISKS